jgi:hypothetical protein
MEKLRMMLTTKASLKLDGEQRANERVSGSTENFNAGTCCMRSLHDQPAIVIS